MQQKGMGYTFHDPRAAQIPDFQRNSAYSTDSWFLSRIALLSQSFIGTINSITQFFPFRNSLAASFHINIIYYLSIPLKLQNTQAITPIILIL